MGQSLPARALRSLEDGASVPRPEGRGLARDSGRPILPHGRPGRSLDPVIDHLELLAGVRIGLRVGEEPEGVLVRLVVEAVDAADDSVVGRGLATGPLESVRDGGADAEPHLEALDRGLGFDLEAELQREAAVPLLADDELELGLPGALADG